MVGRRLILSTLLLVILVSSLIAAQNPVVEMHLFSTSSYSFDSQEVMSYVSPQLKLSISSPNSGNVRGELVLRTDLAPLQSVDDVISKAYLRARFPSWRLTSGKTRLSWGDGVLFNAGDILFGSSSTSVSLTQAELRDETAWMVIANVPLGSFSFLETVYLPSLHGALEDSGLGLRLYTNLGETKVEGGYLFKEKHKLYASLQGSFGLDWYVASSINLPLHQSGSFDLKESWLVSGGLLYLMPVGFDQSLSLRLELLTRPLGSWQPMVQRDDSCALLLYPEVVFSASPSLVLSLRSIISPLDFSASASLAAQWSVFEGFSLLGSCSALLGEKGDLMAPSRALSFSLGLTWIF